MPGTKLLLRYNRLYLKIKKRKKKKKKKVSTKICKRNYIIVSLQLVILSESNKYGR